MSAVSRSSRVHFTTSSSASVNRVSPAQTPSWCSSCIWPPTSGSGSQPSLVLTLVTKTPDAISTGSTLAEGHWPRNASGGQLVADVRQELLGDPRHRLQVVDRGEAVLALAVGDHAG